MILFLILMSGLSSAQVKKDFATKSAMKQKRMHKNLIHLSRMMEIKDASLEKLNSLSRLTKFQMFLVNQFTPMDDEERSRIVTEVEEIRLRREHLEMNGLEQRFGGLSIKEKNN